MTNGLYQVFLVNKKTQTFTTIDVLVANDKQDALIKANATSFLPLTGNREDYIFVAHELATWEV